MTYFLSVEDVIVLHDMETPVPVIGLDRLQSAVGQPSQTFDGAYLYPTLLEQAAVLIRGISQAHGFFDGNKRAGWLAGVTFLHLNGVELERVSDAESERLVKRVATGDANVADVALWLTQHS